MSMPTRTAGHVGRRPASLNRLGDDSRSPPPIEGAEPQRRTVSRLIPLSSRTDLPLCMWVFSVTHVTCDSYVWRFPLAPVSIGRSDSGFGGIALAVNVAIEVTTE
jgi:hypothetical protein